MHHRILVLLVVVLAALSPSALIAGPSAGAIEEPLTLAHGERVLTIIGTNDIHGGLTPSEAHGVRLGGFDWFAGLVAAVRAHSDKRYGHKGQVLLLDAGDAAQGTLLSNHSEGLLMAELMNHVGYTAAIPGNHAYDFGPVGWGEDTVPPGGRGDPLGAIEAFIRKATFPVLGANVMMQNGKPWKQLVPYVLVPSFYKRKVAVIGLENPKTAVTTVPENVAEMKFTRGVDELKERTRGRGSSRSRRRVARCSTRNGPRGRTSRPSL